MTYGTQTCASTRQEVEAVLHELAELGAGASADLREARLIDQDLSGLDLSGVDLRGADLSRANLAGTRLVGGLGHRSSRQRNPSTSTQDGRQQPG